MRVEPHPEVELLLNLVLNVDPGSVAFKRRASNDPLLVENPD
jgi:hypothetical protein